MATSYTIVEPRWVHTRNRTMPLAQMPNMWQAKLHQHNVNHSSHVDIIQGGWRKWAANHPDWYARRAEAQHPDWYTRRVNTIRQADTKERLWSWELTSKPTEKRVYGMSREEPRPVQQGYQAVPHDIQGQVRAPRWGLYHPPHYEGPARAEPLPPLHSDMKHL